MHRREILKMLGVTPAIPYLGAGEAKTKPAGVSPRITQGYNLVVYGATPGGVALAVRSAREGLTVLLVNHNQHLGGMFVNGLGTMDTLYNGSRSPIYDEFRYSIYDYYRNTYRRDSPQYEASQPGNPKTRYESHVAEILINRMIDRELLITVLKGYYPESVKKSGNTLKTVVFREKEGNKRVTGEGEMFADCSYEGDLAFVSGVQMRIGRESKQEFGETHAGIAYTQRNFWPPPANVDKERLNHVRSMNLVLYTQWSDLIMPESTGAADSAVQAFNFRSTLTTDPANRIIPGRPKNYDPAYLKEKFHSVSGRGLGVPNQKTSWNQPELVGEQNKYVEGDWEERRRVTERFREVTLGLLYFKQNDPSVPEEDRKLWREYGLSKNEYPDNGHVPYEIYVREARRVVGRSIFTQHDAELVPGLKRAPVHDDSISITEWFMDSHACTDKEIEGSKLEGEVMLKNLTYPGQVSFDTLFPKELDNLIVPVCLSSTHVGWGTIRLEPTWMSIGEAAGYAALLATEKGISPAKVDREELLRILADKGIMLSFFNDVEGREYAPWYPAVQYLGTKGYFGTYDALPYDLLTTELADAWIKYTGKRAKKEPVDATAEAKVMLAAEQKGKGTVKADAFLRRLSESLIAGRIDKQRTMSLLTKIGVAGGNPISRGDACRLIYEATRKV